MTVTRPAVRRPLAGALLAALFVAAAVVMSARAPSPAVAAIPVVSAVPVPAAAAPSTAAAPSPLPSADLRSSGQGAGAAGNPGGAVWAFLVVLLIGLATAGLTLAYVRYTDARRGRSGAE